MAVSIHRLPTYPFGSDMAGMHDAFVAVHPAAAGRTPPFISHCRAGVVLAKRRRQLPLRSMHVILYRAGDIIKKGHAMAGGKTRNRIYTRIEIGIEIDLGIEFEAFAKSYISCEAISFVVRWTRG